MDAYLAAIGVISVMNLYALYLIIGQLDKIHDLVRDRS